jgi:hypothetical protein
VVALVNGQVAVARAALTEFVRDYRAAATMPVGPFVGCGPCAVRCWLRPDVAALAGLPGLRGEAADGLNNAANDRAAHEELAVLTMSTVRRTVGDVPREAAASLAICLGAHLLAQLGYSRSDQADAAEAISLILQGPAS